MSRTTKAERDAGLVFIFLFLNVCSRAPHARSSAHLYRKSVIFLICNGSLFGGEMRNDILFRKASFTGS